MHSDSLPASSITSAQTMKTYVFVLLLLALRAPGRPRKASAQLVKVLTEGQESCPCSAHFLPVHVNQMVSCTRISKQRTAGPPRCLTLRRKPHTSGEAVDGPFKNAKPDKTKGWFFTTDAESTAMISGCEVNCNHDPPFVPPKATVAVVERAVARNRAQLVPTATTV